MAILAGRSVSAQQGRTAKKPKQPPTAEHHHAAEPPRTLTGYVDQEKEFLSYLLKQHPIFAIYQKANRLVGKPVVSDRQEEFVEFGGAADYLKSQTDLAHASITYRLGEESILDLPNKFVGPKKCGECHPAQYRAWARSRHALNVRFPDEVTEVKDLNAPVYPTAPAAILPPGIDKDSVFAIIGSPRTKYGFLDAWLVRGTYHVEGGNLRDGTGKLVAGGNQFSRAWSQGLTPAVAKKIAAWIPGFPTKMEDFGKHRSSQWGMNSYGSSYRETMMFQPASAYCEVCHSFKFDFKNRGELMRALGNPAELRKHTISKGISCEECHGAGAHLVGAASRGSAPSNCERCHQRFAWNEQLAKEHPDRPFGSYFKNRLPSCGTEGSQAYNTKHKDSGMRCSTCHDPHEVTANDWRDPYTVPALKKKCEDCHATQASFFRNREMHGEAKCTSCHMPVMMSCENFASIQYPDHAGFDTARTSHIWKIKVDPDFKTINPPPGKDRNWKDGAWVVAKDKQGRAALDLQWTCGRTSWSDGHLIRGGGCHSPAISDLSEEYQFKSQKQIYEFVHGWQEPVRKGAGEAKATLDAVREQLSKSKAPVAARAQVQLMVNQADSILGAVEKDGSWGVHAPNHTKRKVEEAKVLAEGARALVGGAK